MNVKNQHCVRIEENNNAADDYFCGGAGNVFAFWCNVTNNYDDGTSDNDVSKQVSQNIQAIKIWEQATNALFYTIVVFATILMGYAYYFHKQFAGKGTDQPSFISLFKFFHQIGDLWTDIIFSIILLYQQHWLSGISIAIVIMSYILTCLVGLSWTEQQRFSTNDRLRIYIEKFDTWLIVGTVFCGFYACINLLCSKLFFLPQCHFQLKKTELIELQNRRFITIILFEAIPQLIIQIVYVLDKASNSSSTYVLSPIVFMAMASSALSIIIAIMSQGSRIYQLFNKQEKLYQYKSLIESKVTIKSQQLLKIHEFSNKTTRSAIDSLFKVCNQFKDRILTDSSISGLSYQIDCYYIESHISATQCMIAYFSIEIFTQTKNDDHDTFIQILNSLNDSQSPNAPLFRTALSLKLNLTDKNDINFDLQVNSVQNRQTIDASRKYEQTKTKDTNNNEVNHKAVDHGVAGFTVVYAN